MQEFGGVKEVAVEEARFSKYNEELKEFLERNETCGFEGKSDFGLLEFLKGIKRGKGERFVSERIL